MQNFDQAPVPADIQEQVTALNNKLTQRDVGSLFTNRIENIGSFNAYSDGKTVTVSFSISSGVASGTKLFDIDDSIRPSFNEYIAPLYGGSGNVYTNGSVWIERNNRTKATYYGTETTQYGWYCSLVYLY